jgi:gliding motility-associated-like protein
LGATDTLCAGATSTLNAGGGFNTYAWSTGAATQTITVGNTGTYSVTVTDGNGCTATASKDLIGSTIAVVDLGPASLNICDNGSAILDAGPQYIAYQWAPVSTPNQYLIVNQPGNYAVTVTDQFGCTSSDNITVSVNAVTALDFMTEDTIGCAGQDMLLDAGDQWQEFVWNTGSPDQYLLVNANGTYEVTVTDSSGCRFSDTTLVTFATPPSFELGPNQNICPDETITLDPGAGFTNYIWSNGSTNQTLDVTGPGVYSVSATFMICTLQDDIQIGDDCPGQLFIPNVFSPNGDGLNDNFKIDHVNCEYLDITIYDRWGKFLYQTGDKNFLWDGKFNGNPLPEGVYYFHVEYKLNANETIFDTKGTITLLR